MKWEPYQHFNRHGTPVWWGLLWTEDCGKFKVNHHLRNPDGSDVRFPTKELAEAHVLTLDVTVSRSA